ncbi:glutamine--tRNA ligase/YqeY domain fusion protein [Kingella kingae]|uniref:glutamine--tRNA ligase/YqeY domain fusion protein n=1 Tax=Kingella kingae TaxID=504 RepID=UPI002549DE8D|nr:glutamine--tRNA ligase/YqeY domain fusion protein [Kingella kingae]MDK4527571.1 glutamine--tRNA ligase/YqeY domain fusion protein [Kingella kingae]MDK4584770.1 glutamine--tRNA ligase/YqeY domain fusion protein [Kingella kingae]MDK4588836.1 glutamine--tRNA ligase/YqeY domain fusion protein [Kingella kingae]MDK4602924.1 glutamine--tRNA ligase/YqeY domain fusion protein [Kingella kingae]MDK4632909.1 glutamine--tRNA ligase/YqeY domain fusion protein [Kingella kingae]
MLNKDQFADNHFIRTIIEDDLKSGKHTAIQTRFPPEPNGYLHIGHAKSICLNFGLAYVYDGLCNLRFDDTNPEKENQEYVDSIKEDVQWLGFKWSGEPRYASDYFDQLFDYAVGLIKDGKAYVDDLTADEMRQYRGTLTEAGKNSPYRERSIEENLDLFMRMKNGEFEDGSKTLRLKIDMASGNVNLRDPVIYRIRRAHHHNTGDKWCIYPMYDYTHAISDAIENITHSLCTLEFEAHRPLYDWVLDNIPSPSHPRQYEFSRLELLYSITSKRKLNQLVTENHVSGWNDPRMPTISGMRRRGYTPEGLRLFAKRIGISKSENVVDMDVLEGAIREELEHSAPRLMAVVNPLKVRLINFEAGKTQSRTAAFHPNNDSFGERDVPISSTIYIEQDDFAEEPPKGWKRLTLGGEVRLRHGYVMKCDEVVKDENGQVVELKCSIDHDTLGKNPEGRKVKGVIHWVSAEHAVPVKVRLYDRLFTVERPDAVRGDDGEYVPFTDFLNPNSMQEITAYAESVVNDLPPESRWQFERIGYFVTDRFEHKQGQTPVFNKTVGLKDTWQK